MTGEMQKIIVTLKDIVNRLTGLFKKTVNKTDSVLDNVTGKVAGAAPSGNKKIMAAIMIAIVVVLIVAVAAVVVQDNGGGVHSKDMLADEPVEGKLGIGTRLTYTIGASGEVDVTIVGQSPGYYLINVAGISSLIGGSAGYQMIHKATGGLRFAFNGGDGSYAEAWSEKTLTEWTISTSDGTDWKFFSDKKDGIPYAIEAENASKVTAVFKSKTSASSAQYVPSSGMGAFYKYSLTGSDGPSQSDGYGGDLYYSMAAEGNSGNKWVLKLIDAAYNSYGGQAGAKYRTVEYFQGSDPQDRINSEYLAGLTEEGVESVSTTDGEKICKVYEGKIGSEEIRTHEAGKVYRSYVKNDDGTSFSILLKDYLSK
ncbi:MAG: hypothetical protein LBT41_00205 [Candidatus Methanoplasma sp.]|nr:hypothetical protein [Candidatus Methanoplasma sp.]